MSGMSSVIVAYAAAAFVVGVTILVAEIYYRIRNRLWPFNEKRP